MTPAVLYARVSSQEQAEEGFSNPAQLKLLHGYAADKVFRPVKEFVDVETAKQTGRAAFNEMVEFLRRNRKTCRTVLVEKTDRLYRNLRDYVTLDELDLEIHFVKENFVLSDECRSTEKFMHGIKVLMAKNYVDNLSEETIKGMTEKAEQGTYPSWAPLGYLNIEVGDRKLIALDPVKAPIVRRMFEWYAAGNCSLEEVRRRAGEAGLTGRRGQPPSKSNIAHTLQNVFYTGLFVWKGKTYQGDHEPLVSSELFQRTQEAFRKDGKPRGWPRHSFAYTGLLTCAYCGCAVTAERKKGKYIYYHCTGFRKGCPKPAIREEALEGLLAGLVEAVTIDDRRAEWIKVALKDSHRDEQGYHDEQIAALHDQYAKLQTKMDRAYDDKLEGKISEDYWQRKAAEWREAQVQVRSAIERHENANRLYFEEGCRILNMATRAYALWPQQAPADRRKLLNMILSNCTFDGTNLTATYAKPFCWLAEGLACTNWLPDVDSNHEHTG